MIMYIHVNAAPYGPSLRSSPIKRPDRSRNWSSRAMRSLIHAGTPGGVSKVLGFTMVDG